MVNIPLFIGFQLSTIEGGAGFRNHPQYVFFFLWDVFVVSVGYQLLFDEMAV